MNLNHLEYFRVLAHLEHYTQAAKELSITQPSLSHAISMLEKELGTPLFEKQGRNVRLTRYGRFFLTYVEQALDEIKLGEQKLKEFSYQTDGIIRLGFDALLEPTFVPKLMQTFLSEQVLTFTLKQSDTHALIDHLKTGAHDLIISTSVPLDHELDTTTLATWKWHLLISSTHPFAHRSDISLQELQEQLFILPPTQTPEHLAITQLFVQQHLPLPNTLEIAQKETTLELVALNYGVSIALNPTPLLRQDIQAIPIKGTLPLEAYLITLKNQSLTPSARLFKDFLLQTTKS